ncbi:putative Synaptic vesicle 2-related protein [Paratrimastix pyriformis]|uniref:Synaptic vesicle 2-related protein n=1 Tax=Paratrimastix pyriformis TaxID=342808 RepID=A0ABQ8UUX5_9EUKA|nr:putative Synaptic vesicle 2-related protein [Paratrimastix pyriformis]
MNKDPDESKVALNLDDALDYLGFGRFQILSMMMCGFCWCVDTMEVMALTFLLVQLRLEWGLSPFEESALPAAIFVGVFIGNIFFGWLSDRLGRRYGYLLTCVLVSGFGLASAFAQNTWQITLFRALEGVGLGGSVVGFSLISELLPVRVRGKALQFFEFFSTGGALIEAGLAWAFLPIMSWRYFLLITVGLMVVNLCMWPFLPESPRFYVLTGRPEKARKVLERIARMNRKQLPAGQLICPRVAHRARPTDLFAKGMWRTTVSMWLIWFIDTFVYYGFMILTPDYFQLEAKDSNYLMIFVTTAAEVPGLLAAALLVDRLGRKRSLALYFALTMAATIPLGFQLPAWAGPVCMICSRMCIMAAFRWVPPDSRDHCHCPLGYSSSWLRVTYTYTPEVFPTAIRAIAMGTCAATSRISGIATSFVAAMTDDSLWYPVIAYASACLVGVVMALLLRKETANKRLADTVDQESTANSAAAVELAGSPPAVSPPAEGSGKKSPGYRPVLAEADEESEGRGERVTLLTDGPILSGAI